MSVNIEQAIENAAHSIDQTSGTHPTEEIKARALISIASSLAAIAAMMYEMERRQKEKEGRS